ncbi:hypothetical protein L1987_67784 [Smallanthus sonchifolius]|uniref:Uncharacterized protein n=1 Tax=Smallanthus sonchifolius TaxID=185202 RepID=A0ACB9B2K1_9ASTR|nr:hypothetical protein L1987_67784 [Smallanthus sonchifolius]
MDMLDQGYDLRALATPRQLPGQTLATVLGRSNYSRSTFPMPSIDQRNTFSFEDSRFRYREVRTPKLPHGISTNMEPWQFISLHQPQHHSVNRVSSQVLMPMSGQGQSQSQNQHVFPNRMLAHGLGSTVSGGRIVPSYNMLNDPNQIRPDSGSQNMTFSYLLTYTSPSEMGPSTSFAVDDEIGTHRDGTGLLAAIFNQPEEGFGLQEN